MDITLKRLTFKKETLRALTDSDMRGVVGGNMATTFCSCVVSGSTSCTSVDVCASYTCHMTVIGECCAYG